MQLQKLIVPWSLTDYTLIHYDVNAWEGLVYQYGLESLRQAGCNVDGLTFDPDMVIRGLIIDKENGNLVKVDRFGCVKPISGSLAHPLLSFHASLPHHTHAHTLRTT